MARMIDAGGLYDNLTDIYGSGDRLVCLKDVLSLINEQPTLKGPEEWVSVKERLPQTGTVLATDGRVVITAPSSSMTKDGPAITHWMPLPELPEMKQEEQ